jgi:GAF domain-containing protein
MSDDDVLERLAQVANDLGPALVPPGHGELLESIAETARSLFGAEACSIALLEEDEEGERLVFEVAVGRGAETVLDLTIPASQGIAGFVVRSGQPLMIDDVSTDARFAGSFAGQTGYVPTAIAAVPLETDRGILGVLEVLDADPDSTGGTRGMELLGHFAGLAALVIESARIFQDLGRVLFRAAAKTRAAADADLGEVLEEVAVKARGDRRELADLASMFVELRRLGPDERRAARSLLSTLLSYATAVRGA